VRVAVIVPYRKPTVETICTAYATIEVIDLATIPGYSVQSEAPARRRPNGRFEVDSEKCSGYLVKAQEDRRQT